MSCQHEEFMCGANVNRIEMPDGTMRFSADIMVVCQQCRRPVVWLGPPPGLSFKEPSVNADGTELRSPFRMEPREDLPALPPEKDDRWHIHECHNEDA